MGNFEIDSEDFWLIAGLLARRDAIRDDQFEFWPDSETEISNSDIGWV